MRTLDEKDIEIVELLLKNARRPYSEIANQVDLSPPTVSDRIDRLQAEGVIRRFTLDVEESKIDRRSELLVEFTVEPGHTEEIEAQLDELGASGRIYTTAENQIIAELRSSPDSIGELLMSTVDMTVVETYEVKIVTSETWTPTVTSGESESRIAASPPARQD